jgi:hypothetical protein
VQPAEYTSSKVWSHFSKLLELPLAQISTNSCADAAMEQGEHPVVLFTHGYTQHSRLHVPDGGFGEPRIRSGVGGSHVRGDRGGVSGRKIGAVSGGESSWGPADEDSEALKFAVETRLADLKL